MTVAIIDDIRAHLRAGTFTEFVTNVMRGHRKLPQALAFQQATIEAHNAHDIDILAPALTIESGRRKGYDYFVVQDFYNTVIPELRSEAGAMMAAVRALVAAAAGDGMAGIPNAAFRTWAAKEDRAIATLAAIDPESSDDTVFIMLALQALGQSDVADAAARAIAFLNGPAELARIGAAMAIGSLNFASHESLLEQALTALKAAIDATDDDHLAATVLSAAVDIGVREHTVDQDILAIITSAANKAGERTIHSAATALWLNGETLPTAVIAALGAIALGVNPENIGTLKIIDHALGAVINKGRLDEALALLEPLVVAHPSLHNFDILDGVPHALLRIAPERLGQLLVAWLMSGERALGEAASALVGQHHGAPLTFRVDLIAEGIDPSAAEFLARKAIGFLFLHPITAASILLSILSSFPGDVVAATAELLFDPLLLNFSGDLSDWLGEQAKQEGDPATPHVSAALAKLDDYLTAIREIGWVAELRPSERERMIDARHRQKAMQDAHRRAQEKSVFHGLFSRAVLLYGHKSINYVEGPGGKKHRQEMKLGTLSHSYEVPRLSTLEPFDLDYKLRVFRAGRLVK